MFRIPLSVQGPFSITPRPRGGDWLTDDVCALQLRGVNVVVSMLESPEQLELDLANESRCCKQHNIRFVASPVPDLGVPSDASTFIETVAAVLNNLRAGLSVAVHCRQSVGRSGLFAVAVAVATGVPLSNAISAVSEARGVSVPETPEQLAWLGQHERRIAGLAGSRGPAGPGDLS